MWNSDDKCLRYTNDRVLFTVFWIAFVFISFLLVYCKFLSYMEKKPYYLPQRRDNITVHPPTRFLPPYYNDNHPTKHANTDPIFVCVFWVYFQQVSPYKTRYLRIRDGHRYRLYCVLITIQLSTRLPNLNDVRPLASQIYTSSMRVPNFSRSATHFFSTWKIKIFRRSQLMYIYP